MKNEESDTDRGSGFVIKQNQIMTRLEDFLKLNKNKKIVGIISIGDVLKIMIKEQKELIDHLQKFITS